MADYINTGQPAGQILTYNVTNDRGWNDPPKHVFSSTNANRKRIDPRKRVVHDLTSTGGTSLQQPPAPTNAGQHGNSHSYMNGHVPGVPTATSTDVPGNGSHGYPGNGSHGYMNGFVQPPFPNVPATVNTDATGGNLHHASSNPDIHKIVTQLPTIPPSNSMPYNLNSYEQQGVGTGPTLMPSSPGPMIPQSNSLPYNLNTHEQKVGDAQPTVMMPPASPNPSVSTCSPPLPGDGPKPQCVSPNRCFQVLSNDKALDGRKLSAPTSSLNNSSIISHLGTPTMLQSSHLASKSSSPDTQATNCLSAASMKIQSDGPLSTPQYPNAVPNTTPVFNNLSPQMSSLPPISLASGVAPTDQNNLYTRTNSVPLAFQQGRQPIVAAPPTDGFYVNGGKTLHSPNSCSPHNSGPNSPVPKKDKPILENNNELLNETVDKLLDCCNKCSCIITNKNSEDINKKIQTFKSAWSSGKLSSDVKLQMSSLSAALEKREFAQADSIHKSLILSHGSEVMSWMVGVKKLISTYQKVVEDNNKY